MSSVLPSLRESLLKKTPIIGIQIWVLIIVILAFTILLLLFTLCLCLILHFRRRKSYNPHFRLPTSKIPAKINYSPNSGNSTSSFRRLLPTEFEVAKQRHDHQLLFDRSSSGSGLRSLTSEIHSGRLSGNFEASSKFTINEIAMATNGFSDENVIGKGENSIVYRGILLDNTRVAVKKLAHKSSQIKNFIAEVEAIGHARHRNLVRMLGYCIEANYRILVNEYVDNGNLHQWLHGALGLARPLNWTIRMKIIQGIAKGLAYLHEDTEPKVFHRALKSTNILLDRQWNPKISDANLTKLNPSSTAEYDSFTSNQHEKKDIYNFGVLVMEIVTGRTPVVNRGTPPVYLVDWLKSMVMNKKTEQVLDPKLLDEIISMRELKRILLISLRCVDPEVTHRPRIVDVIHMLQPVDLLLSDEISIVKREDSSRDYRDDEDAESVCF